MVLSSVPPRWRFVGIGFFVLCIIFLFGGGISPGSSAGKHIYSVARGSRTAANATLGFQKIVAVSGEDSSNPRAWRQKGLVAAANHTGLIVHVEDTHNMPQAETDLIMNLTLANGNHPRLGNARAWAAHERVLKQIVAEKTTSALILEDDVDWEDDIKRLLAPSGNIASAIRRLSASDDNVDIVTHPYGNTYDLLWIGHCGMRWSGKQGPTTLFNITFKDDLVLPTKSLAVYDGKPFDGPPDGYRQVRLGTEVVCTLAYAVTWQAADRLLKHLAKGGGHGAFDIQLTDSCKTGVLRCLTVNPEVFHDQNMNGGPGSIIVTTNKPGKGLGDKTNPADYKPVTWNIRYSARCNAGWMGNPPQRQCLPERQRKALEEIGSG